MEATTVHYMTRKQYMDFAKVSRQNVWNRIKKKSLKTVKRTQPVEMEMIEISQEEYDRIKERSS